MDRLQALGYQLDIRTSAKFSYPEFNKTLFAKVPLSQLHEASDRLKPWQRDELNATQLIDAISKRDKTKSFMSFFFFESTHARYEFPESSVIATPYLKDVNYWGMSRESLKPQIGELKNRDTNAAHWATTTTGAVAGIGSVLLIPELLSKPMRDGADSEIEALAALLGRLDLRPVDEALAELAAALGSAHRLRAADAVHLATAVAAGADRFITNNSSDFPKTITEIEVTYPGELPQS